MNDPKKDLARQLEQARRNKDMSKTAAARATDVSRMTYTLWEDAAWAPGMERASELATFCDMPLERMLTLLARANGFIDPDAYFELRYAS